MLPFARLNLRWNPFGEVPERDRGRLAVVDRDLSRVVTRLAAPGFAVELLGDCGRGKSSHLYAIRDALRERFGALPVTYVDIGARPDTPRAPVVLVDESQHLSPWARRRLFARRASFVLATHESHAGELRRAGVHCETWRVGGPDAARLRAMVDRRVAWARLAPGPLPEVPDALLASLTRAHGDDLRAIGDALYDWFQRRKEDPAWPSSS